MRYYDVPVLTGTTDEKIKQIEQFLFTHINDLNYNLENTTVDKFWQQTAEALTASSEKASSKKEEQLRRDEYNSLRALIIKSATAILKTEDTFSQTLQGAYLAESEHGAFMEEGYLNISGTPYSIDQLYKYQTTLIAAQGKTLGEHQSELSSHGTTLSEHETELGTLGAYKVELEGYIKTGILEKDSSSPVFGMDIGYSKNTFTYNGKTYTNNSPCKIRITPAKIGFYEGSYEVAYIEKKAVYFPVAHIQGGTLGIGDNFSVDKNGNMKATNADISGAVRASEGYIGGFAITGSSGQVFWPCSLASVINPTDDSKNQYVVFLRGNYDKDGNDYGALTSAHNVFGIKKRAKSTSTWENDESPYLFRVSLKGNVYANYIESAGEVKSSGNITGSNLVAENGYLNTRWMKANESRVALGETVSGDGYSGSIELMTSGEILLGRYAQKVKNIYLLASETIRIGQHTSTSAESGSNNYPSTSVVKIEASSSVSIGSSSTYCPTNLYLYAGTTYMSSDFFPTKTDDLKLGDSDKKWGALYTKYISSSYSEIVIGTRGEALKYSKNIYIRSSGNLLLGSDADPFGEAYLVASSKIRIGQYNDSLKTTTITICGSTITIGASGAKVNINGTVKVNGVSI